MCTMLWGLLESYINQVCDCAVPVRKYAMTLLLVLHNRPHINANIKLMIEHVHKYCVNCVYALCLCKHKLSTAY